MTALQSATLDELMDEIKRRSVVCVAAAMVVDEFGDRWHYCVNGSPLLLGATHSAICSKINDEVFRYSQVQADPLAGRCPF